MPIPKEMVKVKDGIWELPQTYKRGMNVPVRIVATEKLLKQMEDVVYQQASNVAQLPGILKHSFCMPDGHWGYGFPIGGVAAMNIAQGGVISPGGIGFDINCGMRLVTTNLTYDDIKPHLKKIVNKCFLRIPSGVGGKGRLRISKDDFKKVLEQGSSWCVKNGYGWQEDLERTEENGYMKNADSSVVSDRAIERGFNQLGTLGSGNHYLEIQVARPDNIIDKEKAEAFGITIPNQVVIMFHCGSRGFGHQVATDYLKILLKVMTSKYGLRLIERELVCAPFHSPEGQAYFSAMKCAVNMAFANRQMILHNIRDVFSEYFGKSAIDLGMHQVYDVAHNIAKLEKHTIDGHKKEVLVHRKGATRALGPNTEELPDIYKKVGQPVIIGGSMETGSHLLAGVASGDQTFFSTAHGSGRVMSRRQAKKQFRGKQLQAQLLAKGIYVQTDSFGGLAEEAGKAYKNIDDVTAAAELAGISKQVVRFVPIGNIKG